MFDKTGTLTTPDTNTVTFHGRELTQGGKRAAVAALATHSTHPYAVRIASSLDGFRRRGGDEGDGEEPAIPRRQLRVVDAASAPSPAAAVTETRKPPVAASRAGWMVRRSCLAPPPGLPPVACPSLPMVRTPARPRTSPSPGRTVVTSASPARFATTAPLLTRLSDEYELALLSGDSEVERARFRGWFRADAHLRFHQSPLDKLEFIQQLQSSGNSVMMVGDGLNDAGALRQSDVGVAVVEHLAAFTPASDVILDAAQVHEVPALLAFSRASVRVVRASVAISILYNVVGLSIAASGNLSPLVCAV